MLQRLIVGLALGVVLILPVQGQKATEIFIPIGKSPGLSGKYSIIGTIDSFGDATGVLTIVGGDGEHTARITDRTKIWLDRSVIRKTNVAGSEADCQKDRWCELKYVYDGDTRTDEAEWIKIRAGESG